MTDQEIRNMFNQELVQLQKWIRDMPIDKFRNHFPHSGDLAYKNISDAYFSKYEPEVKKSYDFPLNRSEWRLAKEFLRGFANLVISRQLDPERRATVIHLFILHEIYHSHQGLSSEDYQDVNYAVTSIQRIDYMADVYSIMACYNFYTFFGQWDCRIEKDERAVGKSKSQGWKDKLEYLIHSVLRQMEIFEPEFKPQQGCLMQLELPRFTRYFTWQFQADRARCFSIDDTIIDDFLLGEWPVFEFKDLQVVKISGKAFVSQLLEYESLIIAMSWADHIYRLHATTRDQACGIILGVLAGDYEKTRQSIRPILDKVQILILPKRDWVPFSGITLIAYSRDEEQKQSIAVSGTDFFDFFGSSARELDFHLVCSLRKLSDHATRCFQYPFGEELLVNPEEVKQRYEALGISLSAIPEDVLGWLAYEDMIVASRMGRLFGEKCSRQVQIDVDSNNVHWADNPTIAVGLGFTAHTKKLLVASGLIESVRIDVTKEEPITDFFKFDGVDYANARDDSDYAIVARVICAGSNVHFICAGRSAPGTAAAGRFLQEKWEDLAKLYTTPDQMSKKSIAVLIKHPKKIETVCSGRIDLIQPIHSVVA
jgi:hypothetical protein